MIFREVPTADAERRALRAAYLADEGRHVEWLLAEGGLDAAGRRRAREHAAELVEALRDHPPRGGDALLHEYDLDSEEGVLLMCLAEALIRIPDATTADRLIRDSLAKGRWDRHLGHSDSLFVNASTWGLMLTGRFVGLAEASVDHAAGLLGRLLARGGEPLVRGALRTAMGLLSHHFVAGRDIDAARGRAEPRHLYSYDVLGEAAVTSDGAAGYAAAYARALDALTGQPGGPVEAPATLSIKLSALHPRFELAQRGRLLEELVPRVRGLVGHARAAGVPVTIDTEEAERLEPTLDVFEAVAGSPEAEGWNGLGLAIQAYQKRAVVLVDWLAALGRRTGRRIPVRLVKGAYWDTEIKRAQERGLDGYPVFTRKAATDVSYLACARRMIAEAETLYPQFATHNAHTVAAVLELAGGSRDFEFQRLYGMGEALYEAVLERDPTLRCRVYAPVGPYDELLPYLVRRLLENGANTSFVNRLWDQDMSVDALVADPVERLAESGVGPDPRIPLPADLYAPVRRNSRGVNLDDPLELAALGEAMEAAASREWWSGPVIAGEAWDEAATRVAVDPADPERTVGRVAEADARAVEAALSSAAANAPDWASTPAAERAAILERAADLLERDRATLMALIVREGGRCIPDALGEVREAADFARYYAAQARVELDRPRELPGPTGERNTLAWHARGVFACISPWNFPLAIFCGQIAAALAAGNAVVAKPAEQTPLVARAAVRRLHEAGVPGGALHLLPGDGETVGAGLVDDPRVAGVAFTGGTDTARVIERALAAREGPIVPLIAETGGQNMMVVDSSALPEQATLDVLRSAFNSAGQRCSALRVLFVQEEIAPRLTEMLAGAMAELRLGDPGLIATDVGPVIDAGAREALEEYCSGLEAVGRHIATAPGPADSSAGQFFRPRAYEIPASAIPEGEVFGPVLHVVRFGADELDRVIEIVNATGYGLTFGVHSRIDATAQYLARRVRAGNIYVNRNMVGSVVGVQPFGGEGLSGTGPKAGGPHYLHRFATERVVTVNTAAVGGNATLLSRRDDADTGDP